MKSFYSHCQVNLDGAVQGSKFLHVHTAGVTDKAIKSLSTNLNLHVDLRLTQLVRLICLYHDLGKYTEHFQNYLLRSGMFNQELKQHAKFGGYALYQKLLSAGYDQLALIALYLIVHHHKSLTDMAEMREFGVSSSNEEDIFRRQLSTIIPYLQSIISETGEAELQDLLHFPDETIRKLVKKVTERNPKIDS